MVLCHRGSGPSSQRLYMWARRFFLKPKLDRVKFLGLHTHQNVLLSNQRSEIGIAKQDKRKVKKERFSINPALSKIRQFQSGFAFLMDEKYLFM